MTRWVAFLRAINVGGRTVRMDHLRGLFAALGLANVDTMGASGNVIFDAPAGAPPALERRLAAHLAQALGYPVAVFVRTAPEVAAVAACRPFAAAELAATGHDLFVAFLAAAPGRAARQRLYDRRNPVDDLSVRGREVYWLRRRPAGQSQLSGAVLEKALDRPATLRNMTTVRKLAAKHAGPEAP